MSASFRGGAPTGDQRASPAPADDRDSWLSRGTSADRVRRARPGVSGEEQSCGLRHDATLLDPEELRGWVEGKRVLGMTLPVWIGLPGKVARRRLLEMSLRVGVGPSLKFLRKQRGLRNPFGRSALDRLYDAPVSFRDDPHANIAGFHYYTFNQLVDT